MKIIPFLIFLLIPRESFTQTTQNLQKEINDQVWKPFIKTFNENNSEGFLALHSKDLVRSPRDGKMVLNWNQYLESSKQNNAHELATNQKRKLSLRFTERLATTEQAIEIGVYKTSYLNPDGSTRDFYGKFLVALRKEKDVWKILVDTDSSEDGTIDEKAFLAAASMEE